MAGMNCLPLSVEIYRIVLRMAEQKHVADFLGYLDIVEQSPAVMHESEVNGVTPDSRQVSNGDIFVAISGEYSDGHNYIGDAIDRGATLIIGTKPIDSHLNSLPYVKVNNSQAALATAAAAYYDFPAKKLVMIGVTGTDGKTTTCNLLFNILKVAGQKTGMITTVNAMIGDKILDTGLHVTTPPPTEVQYYLAQMVDSGITHVILEATSHGLEQHRVDECYFDVAVITNVTHEHLDYHKTFEEYLHSKARLFKFLVRNDNDLSKPAGVGVINRDDVSYEHLSSLSDLSHISYGKTKLADFSASDINYTSQGTEFDVNIGIERFGIKSNFIGDYNVSNCLAAITAATVLNVDCKAIQEGIATAHPVPGRLENIDLGQDFIALVDFAHTPNSIKYVLQALKLLTKNRLICVFGSAGLRDKEKRKLMPRNAVKLADYSVFTAEDPRTESLDDILQDMKDAAMEVGAEEGKEFICVPDRSDAIRTAVNYARAGDLVVSLGKGHEQSMCFGTTEYPWDDRHAMRAAIAERLGLPGYSMPSLPTATK